MLSFWKKLKKRKWVKTIYANRVRHPERVPDEQLREATEMQTVRHHEIIMESVAIIRKTRNDETRRSRIGVCKQHLTYLMLLKPFADERQRAMIEECVDTMTEIGIL